MTASERQYAQIVNPMHPHYPEYGWTTGDVFENHLAEFMERFDLEACKHGREFCYVRLGETGIRRHPDEAQP